MRQCARPWGGSGPPDETTGIRLVPRSLALAGALLLGRSLGTMGVPRELLPCPLPFGGGHGLPSEGGAAEVSRSTLRRARKRAWQGWADDAVTALNELYGHGLTPDSSTPLSAAQASSMEALVEVHRGFAEPQDFDAAGALSELCGTRAGYAPLGVLG